jgi:hypothetical protein
MSIGWIKVVLLVSGLYDGLVGVVFFLVPAALFRMAEVTPPNHFGYVQFPALLLIIFAAMFLRAARDPVAGRETLLYGMALKASYSGLVCWYQFHGGVPMLWIPWAWTDAAFFILFLVGWRQVSRRSQGDA